MTDLVFDLQMKKRSQETCSTARMKVFLTILRNKFCKYLFKKVNRFTNSVLYCGKKVATSADNVNFWFVGMLKNWSTNVGFAKILARRTHSKTSRFSEGKLSQSVSPKKSSDIHIALNYCGKNSRHIWRYVRYSAYGKVQKFDNFWSISMLEAQLFWHEGFIQRLPIFWSKIWINILP